MAPRIVLIGAVGSTVQTLEALIRAGLPPVGVLGLSSQRASTVSGWRDVCARAQHFQIANEYFTRVRDPAVLSVVERWKPSVLMVVGLSQLVNRELMDLASMATIGFHPTMLPEGRGRAPLAWLTLGVVNGGATFFRIGDGTDDGPILVQEPFAVPNDADAAEVEYLMLQAVDRAVPVLVSMILRGEVAGRVQDDAMATYLGKRGLEDGYIDWSLNSSEILGLIRATAPPNPGAFTFWKERKLTVLRARECAEDQGRWRGVAGRVVNVEGAEVLVQCGTGVLRLISIVDERGEAARPPVGARLGYVADVEIADLRSRIGKLEAAIENLVEGKR